MSEISHVSCLASAAAILEKAAIYGAAWDNMKSGEAYPHFDHSQYPDGGNILSKREIRLYFQCSLPELKGGGLPLGNNAEFPPNILHCQFFNWNPLQPNGEYPFWQAIIHPETGDPLVFDGYKLMDGVTLSWRQSRLFDWHTKARTKVRPVWNPNSRLAISTGQHPLKAPGLLKRLVDGRYY